METGNKVSVVFEAADALLDQTDISNSRLSILRSGDGLSFSLVFSMDFASMDMFDDRFRGICVRFSSEQHEQFLDACRYELISAMKNGLNIIS